MNANCRKHRPLSLGLAFVIALCLNGARALPAGAEKAGAGPDSALAFSPRGGAFTAPVTLQLTSSLPQCILRYTLDGSEPDESSAVYQAPLLLTNSALVRAKAFAPGHPAGHRPGAGPGARGDRLVRHGRVGVVDVPDAVVSRRSADDPGRGAAGPADAVVAEAGRA